MIQRTQGDRPTPKSAAHIEKKTESETTARAPSIEKKVRSGGKTKAPRAGPPSVGAYRGPTPRALFGEIGRRRPHARRTRGPIGNPPKKKKGGGKTRSATSHALNRSTSTHKGHNKTIITPNPYLSLTLLFFRRRFGGPAKRLSHRIAISHPFTQRRNAPRPHRQPPLLFCFRDKSSAGTRALRAPVLQINPPSMRECPKSSTRGRVAVSGFFPPKGRRP
ncbi:hypothetical protein STCU_10849 [Strigomonas culicis]|uniref:Uncharacterized protein n=1 Tax=Strigomonas culicis TaxID=28005 RepID=S9TL40_9TRYP|nr:hypothetical protein STCU_10849 [Strigomonas culicis]|eukprot:EPY17043.1 hypothetical protein STCU_10849 [Strigomonas culicis]